MSSPTTVLVTGGNRGIGRAIVESYLHRPNFTIVAGVRDPAHESAKSLHSLPLGPSSKLIVIKLDSCSEFDAKNAAAELQSVHGVVKLDIVIANAGIGYYWETALETSFKEIQEHYLVNSIGPLLLFQATSALMALSGSPKFIVISSVLGSMGAMEHAPLPSTAYGSSKAALNYTTRKIHFENPSVTTLVVHPGWIKTKLGNAGAASAGMAEAPDTLEGNITALLSLFDHATRNESSGKFYSFDGTNLPW